MKLFESTCSLWALGLVFSLLNNVTSYGVGTSLSAENK